MAAFYLLSVQSLYLTILEEFLLLFVCFLWTLTPELSKHQNVTSTQGMNKF